MASPVPSGRSLVPAAQPQPIEGTPYFYTVFAGPTELSGTSVVSLSAGIGSVVVSSVVSCFGVAGASAGWGVAVSGAFAILSILAGLAAVAAGAAARRQVRAAGGRLTGRAMATTGLWMGIAGLVLTAAGFLTALLL